MRLIWSDRAVADLEKIAERSPRATGRIYESVGWLIRSPFPHMFRRLAARPNEHVLVVRPHAVFYAIDGDTLSVLIGNRLIHADARMCSP